MPKLLLCGDFAKQTGFSRVNEALARELSRSWEIVVLAVNYRGDPTPLQQQYRIYPASLGGGIYGFERLPEILRGEQPDLILIVNDPWIAADYMRVLPEGHPPVVLYTPVDATGLRRSDVRWLNKCARVIAYTQFGAEQLLLAGLEQEVSIIPHGIDLDLFQPLDKAEARAAHGMPEDTFAVLVLDQNQARKRLDVAFEAFALFARTKPARVKLIYHGPLRTRYGWDVEAMAQDLGILERLLLTTRDIQGATGIPDDQLPSIYAMCDLKLSATAGEGWGLTTMEAMACGLPCIAPDFAALSEWARGAAYLVPAMTRIRHIYINTVGRIPQPADLAIALENLYLDPEAREYLRDCGLALVGQEQYRWPLIAQQFEQVIQQALEQPQERVEQAEEVPAV